MYNRGRFRSQALVIPWLGRNASFTSGALQDIALKSSVRHLMARRIGRNELGISDPLSDLMFSLEGQS